MGKPIEIKTYETLNNLLGMYTYPDYEVVALEAIANGLDAKANKIEIKFVEEKDVPYVIFHNNGKPMDKNAFTNYHIISSSTKTKGEGIGFAGVGAKIFLAYMDGSEIITITGHGSNVLASRMYRKGDCVEHDSTLHGIPLEKIIGTSKINHKPGTSYKVKLKKQDFRKLKDEIIRILQYWFNYGLTSKTLEVTVDGKSVKPWTPEGELFKKSPLFKSKKIPCYIWISKHEIPEDQRHIVYSVYGKRIKNESVNFAYQIKGDMSNKVMCMADVTLIADQLTSNKEDFKRNMYTNNIKSIVRKTFFETLEQNGLIQQTRNLEGGTNVVINELSKRLDKILQNPKYRFLSLFSNPRVHYTPMKDEDGNTVLKEVEGVQQVGGKGGGGGGGGTSTTGDEDGIGYVEDDDGDTIGRVKQQKSRGVAIIVEPYPDDDREGWADMKNRGIVYNSGHKFHKSIESNQSLLDYNLARVVISALIREKSEVAEWDANTTLQYLEELLHEVWQ